MEDSFVETTRCRRAKEVIGNEDTLVIVGDSGCGKTTLLYHLSANPIKGYLPIRCKSPKEIRKFIDLVQGTNFQLLFVVDEPFGGSYLQQRLVDSWVSIGTDLEMHLGQHKFVFATRSSIWADCKMHFDTSPFFCNKVVVSPSSFTDADKRKMLGKYLGDSAKLTAREIDNIVSIKNPVAFCQCCKLMGDAIDKGQSGDRLVQIFRKPFSYLLSELQKMEKVKYATLCLIMLCGDLKSRELDCTLSEATPEIKEIIEIVWETCGCEGPLHVAVKTFQDCAEKFIGTFLEKLHKTGEDSASFEVYTFSHDSIHEAVIMQYSVRHVRYCLQFLAPDLIVKISRPHSYKRDEQEFVVCVPDDVETNKELAEVFTKVAIVGSWCLYDVFHNPFVREENFQQVWCKFLKSCPDKLRTAFLRSKSWEGECVECLSLWSDALTLARFLFDDIGVECSCVPVSSTPLTEAVSRNDTLRVRNLLTSQKLADTQICQAVLAACKHGSLSVLEILLQEINDDRHNETIGRGLEEACWHGRPEIVEFLLERYYSPCREDKCECRRGMVWASREGRTHIVSILLSHGTSINITNIHGLTGLHLAACYGHTQTVRTFLQNGADMNIRDRYNNTALDLAKRKGHNEIERMLLNVDMREN